MTAPLAIDDPHSDAQVHTWATAIEAGVLARFARLGGAVALRGSATDDELVALEAVGARAREEFVAANLRLVGLVVADYAHSGVPVADLFQEGCLGLVAAVERFDHRRGARFSTYALYWIRACVGEASARQAGAVTIPASRVEQLRSARREEAVLAQRLGRTPSTAEVAESLGRRVDWTQVLLAQRRPRSLDELDEQALDRLPAHHDRPSSREELMVAARRLLATLSGFEREVVERRIGFERPEPSSLAAVARELGSTVGRVRRAEQRALEMLRGRCPQSLSELAS